MYLFLKFWTTAYITEDVLKVFSSGWKCSSVAFYLTSVTYFILEIHEL